MRKLLKEMIKGKSSGRIQVLVFVLVVPMVPSTAVHASTGSCAPLESSSGLFTVCLLVSEELVELKLIILRCIFQLQANLCLLFGSAFLMVLLTPPLSQGYISGSVRPLWHFNYSRKQELLTSRRGFCKHDVVGFCWVLGFCLVVLLAFLFSLLVGWFSFVCV